MESFCSSQNETTELCTEKILWILLPGRTWSNRKVIGVWTHKIIIWTVIWKKKKMNTLQSNSALVCRENKNNFPGTKGKELFLAQGLITPATHYSVKEMGDSPQKTPWHLLNCSKHEARMIFCSPGLLFLHSFSVYFVIVLAILPL